MHSRSIQDPGRDDNIMLFWQQAMVNGSVISRQDDLFHVG
jgi:hypothetical protein